MTVQNHSLVAIVTLISLLLYFMMGLRVGEGRTKFGIVAPAVTGHPEFERRYRVQMNTLEWLPIYIVSLGDRGPKEPFDEENTGWGWRTVAKVDTKDTILPTTCKMTRPD